MITSLSSSGLHLDHHHHDFPVITPLSSSSLRSLGGMPLAHILPHAWSEQWSTGNMETVRRPGGQTVAS